MAYQHVHHPQQMRILRSQGYVGRSNEEKFQDVLRQSESRLAVKDSGFICLISIETALSLINEGNDVIWFSDQQLPHLGLYYSKQVSSQEILGAKTLLSWLASERFEPVAAFKRSLPKQQHSPFIQLLGFATTTPQRYEFSLSKLTVIFFEDTSTIDNYLVAK